MWFGTDWGAPICKETEKFPTPVGTSCFHCEEKIQQDDNGFISLFIGNGGSKEIVHHYECQMRIIVGGANHLRGMCTCCGGTMQPDPPGLTIRKAALLAVKVLECK